MRHGSHLDPPNRFESVRTVFDDEHREAGDVDSVGARDDRFGTPRREIVYLPDASRSIVSENDSPDIPFRYSVNPYRGCVHGCAYCYARNSHEFLGMNAGLDFETKILVKHDAPRLLREFLARPAWRPEPIVFCGVTDCYQPAERDFQLTRRCLEVAVECGQPVGIVTKNALVLRDLDLIRDLAARRLIDVSLSISTLDPALARDMEPRTSIPAARLRAVEELSKAGAPVRVMVAPIVPGLNDHEAPAVLKAAREAGAVDARYVLLRLPLSVEPVFLEWLGRVRPSQAAKVEGLIRKTRDGRLNGSTWGRRMTGTGEVAEQFGAMFELLRRRLGFTDLPPLDCDRFRPPPGAGGQRSLF